VRPGITGHEDNGANGDVSLEQSVCGDDGPNGVCVQVESKLIKGTALRISKWEILRSAEVGVHVGMHALAETRKASAKGGNVQLGGSLRGLVRLDYVLLILHGRWGNLRLGSGGLRR
jgi:hypothetical protein